MLRSGDLVWTPLVADVEFSQGTAASLNMVFNVPADADFWGHRFTLYPYCKVVDPVNGTPDEVAYRPTSFTNQPFTPGNLNSLQYSDMETQVDLVFAFITGGKELQNVNIPAAAVYGSTLAKWVLDSSVDRASWGGALQTPGGMVFDIPWWLPRGKALTVRVTPTYLGKRTIEETILVDEVETEIVRQHKYKIVGVLEGRKSVGAFR